jgi:hypothetical protein
MTFSFGWVLSQSEVFLRLFLEDVLGKDWNDLTGTVITLQAARGRDGITDIEITIPRRVFLIVEAKKGPELPTAKQLAKYAKTLQQNPEKERRIVALTNATVAAAEGKLRCPGMSPSDLYHRSWRRVRSLAGKAAAQERSNENKRWLRTFSDYVGGLLGMEMKYSNRVFVVSLGGKGDRWKITYRDIVEQKNRYFFPVGSRWPDPPPNYLAFRYDGNLQSIHHVKSYTTFTRPHSLFPEAPTDQVWALHYCVELGPAIRPPHKVPNGPRIHRNNRVWCFLDTLLTSKTISDALTATEERERSES